MGVYRKQIEIVGDILYAAEELTIDQYNRGVSTIFELLDAQSRRLSAESLLINSSLLRITNRIKLHLAISSPLFEEI